MIHINEIERAAYLSGDTQKTQVASAYAELVNEVSMLLDHIDEDLEGNKYKHLQSSAERVRELLEEVQL